MKPALGWLRALPHAYPWRADAEERKIAELAKLRDEIRELRREACARAREAYSPEEIKRARNRGR